MSNAETLQLPEEQGATLPSLPKLTPLTEFTGEICGPDGCMLPTYAGKPEQANRTEDANRIN